MSNTALVQKAVGVSLGSGKKFMRDQNSSEAFMGIFDFKSAYVKKDWDQTSGTNFNNLIDGAGVADPIASMTDAANGIVFNATAQQVLLPTEFTIGAGSQQVADAHFMFYIWVTHDNAHTYAANAIPSFGGYAYQTGSNAFYNIYFLCDASGNPNEIRFNLLGQRFSSTEPGILAIFTDGQPHLLAVELEGTSSTTYVRRSYIDGALINTSAPISFSSGALLPDPTTGNPSEKPQLGGNGGYSNDFRGTYHKAGIVDWTSFAGETRTALQIIEDEWSLYNSRF